MRTCNPCQVIRVVELLRNVLTEAIACTAGADAPTTPVIGVRPEKVTNGSFVRGLLDAIKLTDLVQCVDTGGQATVKAEYLVFHHSGKGKVIEKLSELFPDIGITVFPETLIVEAVPAL